MTKIILAQIDSWVGNIEHNKEKIITLIEEAKTDKADAIVFPEYALVGYPFGDIFFRHKSLIELQQKAIYEIQKISNGIVVIFGAIDDVCKSKTIIFKEGVLLNETNFSINGEDFVVVNGEYDVLKTNNSINVIHLSSSSSRCGKEFFKNKYLSDYAKNNNIKYVYINSVGYTDNLVNDGASRIYNENGDIIARAKSFEEDFLITDDYEGRIENIPVGSEIKESDNFDMNYKNDLDRLYKELLCGIKGYFLKNGFKKAVLGLSGGLDSTICAVLLVDVLGKDNVVGVSMPTKISSRSSKEDAAQLAKNLGITYIEAPIGAEVEVFKSELNKIFSKINTEKYPYSTTFENIQARTRATLLWSISNEYKNMIPIATSDKSEGYIGYATTNGDMSGGFAPIADVTKTKLFALGDFLNKTRTDKDAIPLNVLQKAPGAELKYDAQKDRTITAEEDNMPYPFLDEIIFYIEKYGFGFCELMSQEFFYENNHNITLEQKKEWLNKFYKKYCAAVFKWHLMPPAIITQGTTINQAEYYHPIV